MIVRVNKVILNRKYNKTVFLAFINNLELKLVYSINITVKRIISVFLHKDKMLKIAVKEQPYN